MNMLGGNIVNFGVVFCFIILFADSQSIGSNNVEPFKYLQTRLISDGFDKTAIKKLYKDPKVRFDAKSMAIMFSYKESELNYGQFTSPESIKTAREYMETHRRHLFKAEKTYGVNKNIITGIILVETRFGTNLGKRSVLNTLSIIASLAAPDVRELFWEKTQDSMKISNKRFHKKATVKSKWAYSELKAFLKYAFSEKINPVTIPGSFAGAMGIAQFMPSNLSLFGQDGDMDSCVDLFNHADAIASIANYLKQHGWYSGITYKKAHEVVLHYNRSKYYADTILEIAKRLMQL
jgi:membrane-bound lytic murein transglycosylase B